MITIAIEFKGTWLITVLMLLAATMLLCWDYDRWKALVPGFGAPGEVSIDRHLGLMWLVPATAVAAVGGLGTAMLGIAVLEQKSPAVPLLMIGGASVVGIALLWTFHRHYGPLSSKTLTEAPAS